LTYRNAKWLRAVAGLETCVLCGQYGVQAAHRNEGKGMGMKVSDALTAALCASCHAEIDQGRNMTRDERRASMDRAIVLTLEKLAEKGQVVIA
jgi:hypothetical protein